MGKPGLWVGRDVAKEDVQTEDSAETVLLYTDVGDPLVVLAMRDEMARAMSGGCCNTNELERSQRGGLIRRLIGLTPPNYKKKNFRKFKSETTQGSLQFEHQRQLLCSPPHVVYESMTEQN